MTIKKFCSAFFKRHTLLTGLIGKSESEGIIVDGVFPKCQIDWEHLSKELIGVEWYDINVWHFKCLLQLLVVNYILKDF